MADIFIDRLNASFIRVLSDDLGIMTDIYEFFRYEEPGFTKNKYSKWDGVVRMYDKNTGKLPYGLLQVVLDLCKQRGYTFELDPRFKNDITQITREDLASWVATLDLVNEEGQTLTPYDYQLEAAYLAIRYNRMTILAATSAGKSLIQYILIRYYDMLRQAGETRLKTMLMVPSIHLTHQMFNDFKTYSGKNKWDVNQWCHIISEGAIKVSQRPIYICTWQSIKDCDKDYFEQFGNILVDECHTAKAKCIKTICEGAINAYQRVGLTGTLDNMQCLHPSSLIMTPDGEKRIDELKEGDFVITVNETDESLEPKRIKEIHKNLVRSTIEKRLRITVNGRQITMTGNHKVMKSDMTWCRADELKKGDDVIAI